MSKLTAQTKIEINTKSLRRGFDEICIFIDRESEVLPPEELASSYRERKNQLDEQRKNVYIALGSPNRTNIRKWKGKEKLCRSVQDPQLLALYFEIGERITSISKELRKINTVTREAVKSPFSHIFMGVARECLDDKTFNDLLQRTRMLEQEGFMGTNKEWVKFVSLLE